jgi:hypothetical protein
LLLLQDREDVVLADDEVLFTVELDLGARILPEENPVTLPDVQRPELSPRCRG